MEQLRVRAERYRKQGRLRDEDLDEIIKDIKEMGGTKDDETTGERERASTDAWYGPKYKAAGHLPGIGQEL